MTAADRPPTPPEDDAWLTRQEAARYCKVALRTLDHWAHTGRVPYGLTPGGERRFRRSALDAVLEVE